MTGRKRKNPFSNLYWFPLAAAWAAVALPWSVLGQFGLLPAPPGLSTAWGHGHEMLFGFALAVVAGYVLGTQSRVRIFTIMVFWLLARVAFLWWPGSWAAGLFNLAFVLALVQRVIPVFLRTAKKWRNKSVAVIIMGLALTVALFHFLVPVSGWTLAIRHLYLVAVLLLSALMYFMGGRILAPAIAGHLKQQGRLLRDRVQPRLEGGVLLLLAGSLFTSLPDIPGTSEVTAGLLFACALLTLLRVLRWRLWHCLDRADLVALLLGYGWLIVGWLLLGWSLLTGQWPVTLALHAITVGALGTLTLTVMARTRLHRCLKDPNAIPAFYLLVPLISVAALLRLSVAWGAAYAEALLLASTCWSLAYAGLLVLLLALGRRDRQQAPSQGYM